MTADELAGIEDRWRLRDYALDISRHLLDSDVPALVARVRELEAENARLRAWSDATAGVRQHALAALMAHQAGDRAMLWHAMRSLEAAIGALEVAHLAPDLRTPEGWLATPEFGRIEVIDPDGWREEGADWDRPIPRGEFVARLARCTILEHRHLPPDAAEREAP